jgi:hypothetical protein
MNTHTVVKILLVITIIFSASCIHDKNKIRKRDLIPQRELIPLLTDLYIADGLLQYPAVKNKFYLKDTISSYIDVIKKHGYTKEQVDNTLHYYFVGDPKKLQKVYDLVLENLSELQSRIEADKKAPDNNNLWKEKTTFSIPEDGSNNSLYFNIPVTDTGLFSISLSAILYKDDKSLNPRITVFFYKTDSTGAQIKKIWGKTDLARDDLQHNYTIFGRNSDPQFKHISGFLLDCDVTRESFRRHAKFSDIKLVKGLPE